MDERASTRRCDQCGRPILPHEDSRRTTFEVDDPREPRPAIMGPKTRSVALNLCAKCARDRDTTERWFLWGFVALVAGAALIACLAWAIRSLQ
jgi:hypothetical protein